MQTTASAHGDTLVHSLVLRALALRTRILASLAKLDWLALLLGRVAIGGLFASTGWGKVHDLASVTEFFRSLNIPLPGFHAVLVGYSELLGGCAIVLGLCTRLATVPLIVSMVVAVLSARLADVSGVFDLIALEEVTYLVLLTMLLLLGPGRASLDRWLARRLELSA